MGREVRRVPLDFDWPLNKPWKGFLSPERFHEAPCPQCNHGYTDAGEWLKTVAYVITGLADDADAEVRRQPMHPYLTPLLKISYNGAQGRPGSQFAEFADGIAPNVRASFLGRDVYSMMRALVAAAGLPEDWGTCPTCKGHASTEVYPGQRAEAEAWEATPPRTGDGWQYWETVSEGSPISPVFPSAEALSAWLQTDYSWGAQKEPLSKEAADNIVQTGWAPSGIFTPDSGFVAGDAYVPDRA